MSYPKRLKQPLKPQSSPTDHPSQSELIHHLRSDSELLAHEQAAFQPVLDNLSTDNDFLLSKLRIYKDSILKEPRPPGTGIGVGGSGSGSRSQTNQSGPDAVNDAFLSVTGLRHDQGQIPLRGIYGFDERQILKLGVYSPSFSCIGWLDRVDVISRDPI